MQAHDARRELFDQDICPTIYHEPWFLQAATSGGYDEVTVIRDGVVVGRLPYIRRRRAALTLTTLPSLTHVLGPAVRDGLGSVASRMSARNAIVRALLDKLPASDGFMQIMHALTPDMLVFQQQGYNVGVEFNYELEAMTPSALWRGMRDKTRNAIRRASEQVSVVQCVEASEFIAFYNLNVVNRGWRNYYVSEQAEAVCRTSIGRKRGQILGARRPDGRLVGAIFVLWDAHSAYYHMSTRALDAHNGVISLLLWHAVQDAAARGLTFDFEGVGTRGSSLLFAGFGGRLSHRYMATRYGTAYRASVGIAMIARWLLSRSFDRHGASTADHSG